MCYRESPWNLLSSISVEVWEVLLFRDFLSHLGYLEYLTYYAALPLSWTEAAGCSVRGGAGELLCVWAASLGGSAQDRQLCLNLLLGSPDPLSPSCSRGWPFPGGGGPPPQPSPALYCPPRPLLPSGVETLALETDLLLSAVLPLFSSDQKSGSAASWVKGLPRRPCLLHTVLSSVLWHTHYELNRFYILQRIQ